MHRPMGRPHVGLSTGQTGPRQPPGPQQRRFYVQTARAVAFEWAPSAFGRRALSTVEAIRPECTQRAWERGLGGGRGWASPPWRPAGREPSTAQARRAAGRRLWACPGAVRARFRRRAASVDQRPTAVGRRRRRGGRGRGRICACHCTRVPVVVRVYRPRRQRRPRISHSVPHSPGNRCAPPPTFSRVPPSARACG